MRYPLFLLFTLGLVSFASAQTGTALVKHAPTLNGTVQGSVQQMLGENVVLNGGTIVTGDLLVPGLPAVQRNGNPTYAGTIDAVGAATPTGYQVTLNGSVSLRNVIRRTNPLTLPTVAAPPSPTGSRTVVINAAGQSAGDFATLRHLTLNGSVGQFAIPPGTYGDFTANGGSGFTLGVAGSTAPSVYNFQRLTLNGSTAVQVVGPVILTVAYGFTANGHTGSSTNPSWLALKIYSGNFILNGGSDLYAFVTAPSSTVTINGNSQLIGGVTSDRLTLNGSGLLKLTWPSSTNQPPIAQAIAVTTLEDTAKAITLSATDSDAGALTYSVVTPPLHGTLAGVAPALTYQPALNYNGADSFTFKANDGLADSALATVSITVSPVNDAPVANAKSITTAEDTPITLSVSGSDVESSSLTFSVSTPPIHGVISGVAPNFIYTPASNYHGADSFAFTVNDGSVNSAPATVSIVVTSVNDVPVATPRSVSVQSGSSVAIVLAGADADGDALTFSTVTSPAHGILTGAAPNLTYTPTPGFTGSDTFTFRAFDGAAYSAPVAVAIAISPRPNGAPMASAQSVTTAEDAAKVITLAGIDPDADALTFAILTPPSHGMLVPKPGAAASYTYTPALDYSGVDAFSFKASDGTLDSAAATVAVTITPVNDAPVANAQTLATNEDTALPLTLTGSDVEGGPLTFTIVTPPTHGTLTVRPAALGGFTYTPTNDFFGEDSFLFKTADGALDSAPSTVALSVRPINDAPVATPLAEVTTAEDSPIDLVLAGTDVDGDTVTSSIETPPAHGALQPKVGALNTYTYVPEPNFNGADTFTFKATDALLSSAPSTVILSVTSVNDAPVSSGQTLIVLQDTPNSLTLSATDVENDTLTYEVVTLPTHGTLSGSGANRIYTSALGFEGGDSFTFRARDGALDSNVSTITLTVVDINHPPIANAQSATLVEDTPKTLTLAASDADGDPLTYLVVTPPSHGTLTPTPGAPQSFVYTPAADYSGSDSFVYKVRDGSVDSVTATVTLTITGVNDAPVAIPQALATDEDIPLTILLTGTDVESATLTYSVIAQPVHGTLTPEAGAPRSFVYTPTLNFSGADSFTFKVNDGALDSATATVALTIRVIDDAPVAIAPAPVSVPEDTSVDITLAGSDVDSAVLTRVIVAVPGHGTLIQKAGAPTVYTYAPALNYFGADSFTFKLNDGTSDSSVATVAIDVASINDLPAANAAVVALMSGVPTPVTLTGSDVETAAASLVYAVVAGPARGTLTGIAPNLTYVSAADFSGSDSFTFTVNDGTATSSAATIQLNSGLPPRSRTYTTTADFAQGELSSLSSQVADELSNTTVLAAYDVVWVANSSKGTVVKIDSETARVLGEYRTAPESVVSPYPSRLAVDSKGNAWVANYAHGSIVKIGLPETRSIDDRNHNGVIETSGALGDVKAWSGVDSVASAGDEAILLYIHTAVSAARHISVDAADNVWVGGPNGAWQKFDGRTGALLRTEPSQASGGQGGFISPAGKLYSTGSNFLIWRAADPIDPLPEADSIIEQAWASALDSHGNLWVTRDWSSTVVKYSPTGEKLGEFYHGEPWAMGIAVDANDHIWIAHSHCGHSVGHLLPDGRFVGNVEVANHGPVEVSIDRHGRIWVVGSTGVVERINPLGGPFGADGTTPIGEVDLRTGNLRGTLWTYGRFTGSSFGLASPDGLWTNIFDAQLAGTTWGPAVWNGLIRNSARIEVDADLSDDGVTFGPVQRLTLANPVPAGSGRYLRTRVRFVSATTGEAPTLSDLTVGTSGYTPMTAARSWLVSAGEDITGNWSDSIQLKGAFVHSVHEFPAPPSYSWSVVSGPGAVTFDSATVLRPQVQFSAKGAYVLRVTATLDGVVSVDDVAVVLTPYNRAPYANAGYTTFVSSFPPQIWLWGDVRDDGLPLAAAVTSTWEKLFGPGVVSFTNSAAAATKASFSVPGVYTLRLKATDGELSSENTTDVWIGIPPPPPAPSGLVSWWAASGNGDDHISGNQAFTERGADYADGKVGGGFRFAGVNERVRVFSSPSLNVGAGEGITVELWVNPTAERAATLIHLGEGPTRGFQIRQVARAVEVNFRDINGTDHPLTTGNVLTVGTWTHLTASYDRATGEARIFTNGILRTTQNLGSYAMATQQDLFMGARADGGEPYAGVLDEISVYNRAIYADEVTSIVTFGKRPPVSNLPPMVSAGVDLINQPVNSPAVLMGTVTDDGQPVNGGLTSTWTKFAGPGNVTFANAAQPQTTATFSSSGLYWLKLSASDGAFTSSDLVEVRVATYGETESDASLVAWWPGNGSDADVENGHKIERFHGADFGPGQIQQSFVFDGENDHGRVKAHTDLDLGVAAEGFTVEMWVLAGRTTSAGQADHQMMLAWGTVTTDGVRIETDRGALNAFLRDGSGVDHTLTAVGVFTANVWTHIAITYDRRTGLGRLFRNGTLVSEQSLGSFAPQTSDPLTMGASLREGLYYQGSLDEISLYKRPLSVTEIDAIYRTGAAGKIPADDNRAPSVDAGPDVVVSNATLPAALAGSVTDDARPIGGQLSMLWTKLDGPGAVTFSNANSAATTATFTVPGTYVLKLTANDGLEQKSDTVVARVGLSGSFENDGSLAAWWPANGEPHEVVRGNHDLEFYNGATYGPGQVSQALTFDGINDHSRIAAHTDLDIGAAPSGFTVEMWVQAGRTSIPTPTTDHQIMLSWGSSTVDGMRIDTDRGSLNAFLQDTAGADHTLSANAVFAANVWTHIAVTYDKVTGVGRLFRDGTLVKEQSLGIFTPRTNLPLTLGTSLRQGLYYQGSLDEVSLYMRPLSVGEIAAIYQTGSTGKNPPDDNQPPVVNAGPDIAISSVTTLASLVGAVSDDGRPAGGGLNATWSKVDGPGTVTFANPNSAVTGATFGSMGTYVLRLTASDGFNIVSDTMVARVGLPTLPAADASLVAWWPTNGDSREAVHGNHDIEFYNGLAFAPGAVSQGIAFDGINDHGRVSAHADLDIGASPAGLTIELWVKAGRTSIPDPISDHQLLISWGTTTADGVQLDTDRGRFNAFLRDTAGGDHTLNANGFFALNTWTHVAVTYDKATGVGSVYRNGALLVQQSLGIFTPQTGLPLSFGLSRREGFPYQGSLDEISFYNRPLALAEIQAICAAGENGKAPLLRNLAPIVDAGFDTTTQVGAPVSLVATATDDGVPNPPSSLTYQWSLVIGPGAVTFLNPTGLSTQATFNRVGNYTLRFTSSDSALSSSDDVTVVALPAAPSVAIVAPSNNSTVPANATITLLASAADADGTIAKVEFFDGAVKLGESLTSPYSLLISAGLNPGSHTITARATDNSGLTTTSAPIAVTSSLSVSLSPTIAIFEPAAGASLAIATYFEIAATATDADGTIAKVEFFQGVTKLGEQTLPELGHPTTYFWPVNGGLPAGTYVFSAKATDNSGTSTTSAPVTITVSSTPAVTNYVFIETPEDTARIAAPTSITGVVALPGLSSWNLQYRLRPAGEDTSTSSEPWLNAASGTAAVGSAAGSGSAAIPGIIGTFDPTGLINGLYELRLSASTAASATTTLPICVIVEGSMKVGAFTLAFEDLKLPVSGIPISVTRTYDSRDARVGDFGPGWSIAVANVRVQKNRHLGTGWYQTPQSGSGIQFYYVDPVRERVVTITMPDGETHRFRAGADVKVRVGDPDNASFAVLVRRGKYRFYPLGDTTSKLEPLNTSNQLSEDFWIAGTGDQDLRGDDPVANPFAPTFNTSRFRLTTKDGSVYLVDEELGLIELRDLNGNALVLNRDGQNRVTSLVSNQASAGGATVSMITIVRDATGRIDYIRDPANRDIDYIYDGAGRLSSVTNRALEVTQFRYENPSFPHYLTTIVDPRGIPALRTEFDSAGRLIKQIDADGKETVFARGLDGTGRFEKVKDRLGHESTFYYDARGNVTLKIDPLGGQTAFTYDANDNPLTVTDPLGHTRSTTYDARNNPLLETDPLGHSTTFTYNALSLPLTITDARGKVTTNAYDGKGNLLTTTNAKGEVTSFTYDAGGRLTQVKNALNQITTHTYTVEGWPASTTDALGHVTGWTYDSNGNRLAQTRTRTRADGSTATDTTAFAYDAENRLIKTTAADGAVTQIAYHVFGKTSSATDPLGHVTNYSYDTRGNLITTAYADTTSESSSYDEEGRVISTIDRAGHSTGTIYDALNRPTRVTYADGSSSQTSYDAAGRVMTTTDARGNVTTFGYDAAGRRTSVKNALNETTTSTFDESGSLLTFTDALGRTTRYAYDDTGIRTATTFSDSTTEQTVYDALGRKVSLTDQAGKIMRWRYDALGRLSEVRQYLDQSIAGTDADYHLAAGPSGLLITSYAYDEIGNQISQTDALGRVTRYAYDALGRRTKRTLPGNQTETYSYDLAGNVSSRTDFNGHTTTFVYDSLNRVIEKRADNSHPSLVLAYAPAKYTYIYNALGQRTQASVLNAPAFGGATLYTESYSYDSRNRPTTRTTSNGTLTYGYDAVGNLTGLKSNDAASGIDVIYDYDAVNRLATVGTRDPFDGARKLTSYGYDAVGNLSGVSLPNSVSSLYTYDTLNRLRTLTADRLCTLFSSYTYAVNAAGHRTSVTELNNRRHDYAYDALYRLTSETIVAGTADFAPTGVIAYTHDAVGNRLSRSSSVASVSTTSNAYDSNDRLTTDSYDANGNTLQGTTAGAPGGATIDVYDFENRLIGRNSGAIKLVYDCDGHRVSETVGAQTISYLVDAFNPTGYAQVVEERVNGTLTRTYAYGHSLISQTQVALSPAWATSYYGYDGHGSTAFLTDSLGTVTDTYRYDAFGNLIARTSTAATPTFNRYRYTGQQYDDDLGLYYLRARYMNPDSGRFWNADEFEGANRDPQSLHRYTYAGGNPVMGSDPTGYMTLTEVAVTSGVVGVLAKIAVPALRNSGFNATADFADAMGDVGLGLSMLLTAPEVGLAHPGIASYLGARGVDYMAQGLWSLFTGQPSGGTFGAQFVHELSGIDIHWAEFAADLPTLALAVAQLGNATGPVLKVRALDVFQRLKRSLNASSTPDIVFRRLHPSERATALTKGLTATSPGSVISPTQHILGMKPSRFISATRDYGAALTYNRNATSIVEIDLSKVTAPIIDLTKPGVRNSLQDSRAIYNATRDSEVLIDGHIPPAAIRRIHYP